MKLVSSVTLILTALEKVCELLSNNGRQCALMTCFHEMVIEPGKSRGDQPKCECCSLQGSSGACTAQLKKVVGRPR